MTPQHTQMLMAAIQAASNLANSNARSQTKLRELQLQYFHDEQLQRTQLDHDRQLFGMKADLVRDLIEAVVEKRVDAVRKGFTNTLGMYAEQCRHYLDQQDRYADAEIKATDPLERASLRARLCEIDLHLSDLRLDAAALYREMTRTILLIGGSASFMSSEHQRVLALPNHH
jgi:hypothetical protein